MSLIPVCLSKNVCAILIKMGLILSISFMFIAEKTYALTYLFSHGFADRCKQYRKYVKEYKTRRGKVKKNEHYIMQDPVKIFNYPDAACKPFVNIFKTCLAQEQDLQALKKAYDEIQDDEIVLVGVSRGASAVATFMGVYQPKKIKAVVLISPFDHLINVFKQKRFSQFLYRMLCKLSCFKEDGKHPIEWLCKMDKTIPVIFICSKKDKTVPCQSTINLYKSLVNAGHAQVYLLCLPEGKHAKLLKSNYAELVQNVVHAFYAAHNLPHASEFACVGASHLQQCAHNSKSLRIKESVHFVTDDIENVDIEDSKPEFGYKCGKHDCKSSCTLYHMLNTIDSFITVLAYCVMKEKMHKW